MYIINTYLITDLRWVVTSFNFLKNTDLEISFFARSVYRELFERAKEADEMSIEFVPEELANELAIRPEKIKEALAEIVSFPVEIMVEEDCGEEGFLRFEFPKVCDLAEKVGGESSTVTLSLWRQNMNALLQDAKEPDRKYIPPEERESKIFKGYLPTRRYSVSGEAFCITSELTERLKGEFKNIDLENELQKIFLFLMNKPVYRVPFARMNGFIGNWLSKEKEKINNAPTKEQLFAESLVDNDCEGEKLSIEDELRQELWCVNG